MLLQVHRSVELSTQSKLQVQSHCCLELLNLTLANPSAQVSSLHVHLAIYRSPQVSDETPPSSYHV